MPVFFMISGYFYRPENGFRLNMKKRGIQLAVALVICSFLFPTLTLIWLAILGELPADVAGSFTDAILRSLYVYGIGMDIDVPMVCPALGSSIGYYFLWTMLFAFVIFYALAQARSRRRASSSRGQK